jgi:hypothetical protein
LRGDCIRDGKQGGAAAREDDDASGNGGTGDGHSSVWLLVILLLSLEGVATVETEEQEDDVEPSKSISFTRVTNVLAEEAEQG